MSKKNDTFQLESESNALITKTPINSQISPLSVVKLC